MQSPNGINDEIECLKQWIHSQPHITMRTDDNFLKKFLQIADHDLIEAQRRVDYYCTMRSSALTGVPDFYDNLDPFAEELEYAFDCGYFYGLPGVDDNGCKVFMINAGLHDPAKVSANQLARMSTLSYEAMGLYDGVATNGVVGICDVSKVTVDHVFMWSPDLIGKCTKCMQDNYPLKVKEFHYWSINPVMKYVFLLLKFFLNKKSQNKIHFQKHDLELLHSIVPKRMLPTEYGGDAGSERILINNWKNFVFSKRSEILENNICKVDEEKRPQEPKKSFIKKYLW